MKRLIIFTIICILCNASAFAGSIEDVSVKEAAKLLNDKDLIIIDVRTPAEYKDGHLKNAKNIDYYGVKFEREVENLPKKGKILLYCKTGVRSEAAAEQLKKDGYENILNMKGGMNAWVKEDRPIEK